MVDTLHLTSLLHSASVLVKFLVAPFHFLLLFKIASSCKGDYFTAGD